MKNPFLLFLVVLALFLAGCSAGDISGSASGVSPTFSSKKLGELVNDPSVQVTEKTLPGSAISASLNGAAAGCVGLEPGTQYTLVEAFSPTANYSVVLGSGSGSQKILCVVRKEKLADQCRSGADCDDGLASTTDSCSGEPKVCNNARTTECKSGDSFCPQGCVKNTASGNNDDDCLRECDSDGLCDDGDPTTKDSCGGPLSRCINLKIFVGGKEVIACSTDNECAAENVCSAGTCTRGVCVFDDKPNGTVCDSSQGLECFDGECTGATEHPVRLVKTKTEWVNDGSSAGKINISASTSKLSTFEVNYGTSPSLNSIQADVYCPSPDTCNKTVSTEHDVELANLNLNSKYYYQLTARGLSGLTVSQTEVLEFFTCPPRCNDSDAATVDSCDIKTGKCVYQK